MGEELTVQQRKAVFNRGGKMLVSAAAGSGKTKVLVDRILSYLKDSKHPANVDDFLVITYTKAAATELRGKIASKLSEEIAKDPRNRHLQKQMQRLYLAKISTVHSYCGDLLREYAYQLDIPADFRVAEETECDEMQRIIVEKILDGAYKDIHNDPDFSYFVATQGFGRNDRQLSEVILKLHKNARCHMDPDGWLDWCFQIVCGTDAKDITNTAWAQYLIDDLHHYLDLQIDALKNCIEKADAAEGLAKPVMLLRSTVDQLEILRKCSHWDQIVANANLNFGTLSFPRKDYDIELAAHIKAVRENCKSGVVDKLRWFSDNSSQVLLDISQTASAARGLIALTKKFIKEYDKHKKAARILDFGDLEHKALDLLRGKRRQGPTTFADEIGRRYREVMVDEYQDSNEVQDAIFSAITDKRQNCFMVGDVKQSIYQFRRADPEIFIEKYNTYLDSESAQDGEGRRVVLSSNFRSAEGVINAVNDVFSVCMSRRIGGLRYGPDEMLYEGIPHEPLSEPEVELYGIEVDDSVYSDEPEFVAQRVSELLDGCHKVRGKEGLRTIEPKDIAILLRSPGSIGLRYMEALARHGIPCISSSSSNLLDTEEVQTLYAILQIIDNPLQDIPLISALTSKVFAYTSDDLARIRTRKRDVPFFNALKLDDTEKSVSFIHTLNILREKARTCTLLGLIKYVFSFTKLDSVFSALSDGELRMENLLAFYKIAADYEARGGKSLSLFINYLDSLADKGIAVTNEYASAEAVKLMSIHKSKGLEFPVVFLPGLSRKFNNESAYDNLLCDKDLGIGLNCIDFENRVRYPSVSKRAISRKILDESLSEEMRVLYVAMTRAKDRLIMTYTSKNIAKKLTDIAMRMPYSNMELLTGEVNCPGDWILISAMMRMEAGAFFSVSTRPENLRVSKTPWLINLVNGGGEIHSNSSVVECELPNNVPLYALERIKECLDFRYPFVNATTIPSKQTATQLKGREKDNEISDDTDLERHHNQSFNKPAFLDSRTNALKRGNAMHLVMQYIRYTACDNRISVVKELERLVSEGCIDPDILEVVDPDKIVRFFNTDIGKRLMSGNNVLREFKFSILDDASKYSNGVDGEEVLLQGVVDCALIEPDGITVVDFKTDRVNPNNLKNVVDLYRPQVKAYAEALTRIYQKPVKAAMLYFFETDTTIII